MTTFSFDAVSDEVISDTSPQLSNENESSASQSHNPEPLRSTEIIISKEETKSNTLPLLTCLTCQLTFSTPQRQRTHYRSDLHFFNSKRKAQGLEPVSETAFLQQLHAILLSKNRNKSILSRTRYCKPCRKKFLTDAAFSQHVASKKHVIQTKHYKKSHPNEQIDSNGLELTSDSDISSLDSDFVTSIDALQISVSETESETEPENDIETDPESELIDSEGSTSAFNPENVASKSKDVVTLISSSTSVDTQNQNKNLEKNAPDSESKPLTRSFRPELPSVLDMMNLTEEELAQIPLNEIQKLATTPHLDMIDDLFSSSTFSTLEENLEHMYLKYGFYIPYLEHCWDAPGLIRYLHHKINLFHECFQCQKTFHSAQAIKSHMLDANHCRLKFDDIHDVDEFSEFYNFDVYGDDNEDDGEDGEVHPKSASTSSTLQSGLSQERAPVPSSLLTTEQKSKLPLRTHPIARKNPDIITEWVLADGTKVGNKKFERYYRQNHSKSRTKKARAESNQSGEHSGGLVLAAPKAYQQLEKSNPDEWKRLQKLHKKHQKQDHRNYRNSKANDSWVKAVGLNNNFKPNLANSPKK